MPREDVLAPHMPTDPLMAGAWISALKAALDHGPIVAAFRAETGNRWEPGRTVLERMVDEATGAEADFFRQFAAWFNQNVWGESPELAG